MSIILSLENSASIANPPAGKITLHGDLTTNSVRILKSSGQSSLLLTSISGTNIGSGSVNVFSGSNVSGSTQQFVFYSLTGSGGVSFSLSGSTLVVSSALLTASAGTDGITWTSSTTPGSVSITWNSVDWSPQLGMFCAVGSYAATTSDEFTIMTSIDGKNWTSQSSRTTNYLLGSGTSANLTNAMWGDVAWSPQLGVFVATNKLAAPTLTNWIGCGRAIMSADRINWMMMETGPGSFDAGYQGVCWSPEQGRFVAVGAVGTYRTMSTIA